MPKTSGLAVTTRSTSCSFVRFSQKASMTSTLSFRTDFRLDAMYNRPSGGHSSVVFPGGVASDTLIHFPQMGRALVPFFLSHFRPSRILSRTNNGVASPSVIYGQNLFEADTRGIR